MNTGLCIFALYTMRNSNERRFQLKNVLIYRLHFFRIVFDTKIKFTKMKGSYYFLHIVHHYEIYISQLKQQHQ